MYINLSYFIHMYFSYIHKSKVAYMNLRREMPVYPDNWSINFVLYYLFEEGNFVLLSVTKMVAHTYMKAIWNTRIFNWYLVEFLSFFFNWENSMHFYKFLLHILVLICFL